MVRIRGLLTEIEGFVDYMKTFISVLVDPRSYSMHITMEDFHVVKFKHTFCSWFDTNSIFNKHNKKIPSK